MVYIITCIFIVFDFLTGFLGAVKEGKVSSKKLREGIWHKCGFIMLIVFAKLLEYGQLYLYQTEIPLVVPVCVYIVTTEIVSILENICKMNPEILPEKLKAIFEVFTKE